MRKSLRLLPVLLVLGLAAACGSDPSGSSGSGGTTAVSVPTGSVSAAQGAFQYTIAKGFFSRNHLDVTTPLSAEGQLKAAIVAGSIDFDQLAGGDVLDLYAKHVDIKAVACTATNTGYYLYTQKGTSTLAGLNGKTVGVPSLGGAPQVAMEAYLAAKGLSPTSVKFVALGSIPNVLAALTSGKVDSGLLSTPFNAKADAAGLPDLGYATGPPTPYIVNATWAKQNPTVVNELLSAMAEGGWAFQKDEAGATQVLAKFLSLDPVKDAATLKRSFNAYLPPVQSPPGRCRAQDFAPYVKYQPAAEQTALANLGPLFDNSYVDALDKKGFYTGLQKKYGPLPKATTLAQVLR
jgi:ABC-type nitrate/sulfonate/bicarbonate transport system substrate-binding protein